MFRKTAARSRPDLFVSAKTSAAIPARQPALREALIQASLDPQVRTIGYVATAHVASEQVDLGAVVLRRDDGTYVLDVVPARPIRDLEDEGLALIALADLGLKTLTVTAEDIRRQPRYGNAQAVWAYRMHPVGIEMRMRILTVLQEDGPLRLGCLLQRVRAIRDPAPAVMALACSDLLELDLLSAPLAPTTMVGSRS